MFGSNVFELLKCKGSEVGIRINKRNERHSKVKTECHKLKRSYYELTVLLLMSPSLHLYAFVF